MKRKDTRLHNGTEIDSKGFVIEMKSLWGSVLYVQMIYRGWFDKWESEKEDERLGSVVHSVVQYK